MRNFTDETPIAMLTVGQLKEILSIDRIMGKLADSCSGQRGLNHCRGGPLNWLQ